ncbi:MAG: ankyrin repeat domain-containing protein [bacterium]|nr:ankyrin repeat domain-containing protein [bacterium]
MKTSIYIISSILLIFLFAFMTINCKQFGRQLQPIHKAVMQNDIEAVKTFISNGTDIDIKDGKGWTPLHWAASRCYSDILALLIKKGAKVNAENKFKRTPLHLATQKGCLTCVKILIDNKAHIDQKDSGGRTALHWASAKHKYEMVVYLVENGANINAVNKFDGTPLNDNWSKGLGLDESIVNFLKKNGGKYYKELKSK